MTRVPIEEGPFRVPQDPSEPPRLLGSRGPACGEVFSSVAWCPPSACTRGERVSGGLTSKGHPIGATGVANIDEVATRLWGEAGDRQIEGAGVGRTHVIGLGSACVLPILERGAT